MTAQFEKARADVLRRVRAERGERVRQSSPRRAHALLRAGIRRRVLATRDAVAEHHLVMSLMMTRNSIRSALQMLDSEGLVQRRQRTGTTVIAGISELPLLEMLPVPGWRSSRTDAEHPSVGVELQHLERAEVPADEQIRARLELDGDRVVLQEDLVHSGGDVVGVIVGYHLPEAPDVRGDLEAQLEQLRAMSEARIEATVEAVNCDERTAKMLNVAAGAALLVRETLVRDSSGRPRMLAYGHYRGDRVALWARDDNAQGLRRAEEARPD